MFLSISLSAINVSQVVIAEFNELNESIIRSTLFWFALALVRLELRRFIVSSIFLIKPLILSLSDFLAFLMSSIFEFICPINPTTLLTNCW